MKKRSAHPRQIKDFQILLKDLEPFVKDPSFLYNGRPIENFNLLPREVWGNWLFCAVLRALHGPAITFADVDDGLIIDKLTWQTVPIEHVSALEIPGAKPLPKGEARIIQAIEHKVKRGPEYAVGKFLLVFCDGAGKWYRDKVRMAINGKHNFKAIYTVNLTSSGPDGYSYTLTQFHPKTPHTSESFKVKVNSTFTDWEVVRLVDHDSVIVEVPISDTSRSSLMG